MRKLIVLLVLLVAAPAWPWSYTLDFESGTVGQDATGSGGFSGVEINVKYASDKAHSGSKSAKFTFAPSGCPSDRVAFGWFDHPDLSEGSEIWVRWYQWVDSNWSWPNNYVKFARLHTTLSDGTSNEGFVGLGDGWNSVYYGNEPLDVPTQDFSSMTKGQWQCWEMYHKISRTGGTAIARVWRDGVLVFTDNTHANLRSAGDLLTEAQFYGTSNCPGISQTQYIWMDDIIITSDRPSTQDAYGNYMIGTGSYTPGDTTPPTVSSPSPSGAQTYVGNPQSVVISVNASDSSGIGGCRYSNLDIAYASMANTLTNTSGSTYAATLSLTPGTSYTYYARCSDSLGNANTSSTAISFSINAAGGGLSPATFRGERFSGGKLK